MTKPFESSSTEWTDATLPDEDAARIFATLPDLPAPLAAAVRRQIGTAIFNWRADVDAASDPTATDAAAWFESLRDVAEKAAHLLDHGPAALRQTLYELAAERSCEPAASITQIKRRLALLATLSNDGIERARCEMAGGRGGPRRALASPQRFYDAVFDTYAAAHRSAPDRLPAPSWSKSGRLPHFFSACVAAASGTAFKYRFGSKNEEPGKHQFDDWSRRRKSKRKNLLISGE